MNYFTSIWDLESSLLIYNEDLLFFYKIYSLEFYNDFLLLIDF